MDVRLETGASTPPVPVIVGVGRSGTTLLRLMLDAHSDLAIPPETGFIPTVAALKAEGSALREAFLKALVRWSGWPDFNLDARRLARALLEVEPFDVAGGVQAFYEAYAARFGKPRWGDKTPTYCIQMQDVQVLIPTARFIHLIRDGRDVALSAKGLWWAPGDDVGALARDWRWRIETARQLSTSCRHYRELRYEDLVEDPDKELRRICAFIELPYEPRMLRYFEGAPRRLDEVKTRYREDGSVLISKSERLALHRFTSGPPERSRVYRWRREMSPDARARFAAVAGPLLEELGYVP